MLPRHRGHFDRMPTPRTNFAGGGHIFSMSFGKGTGKRIPFKLKPSHFADAVDRKNLLRLWSMRLARDPAVHGERASNDKPLICFKSL